MFATTTTEQQSLIEDKMKLPKKMNIESPWPSGVIGILREALTIPTRSWKVTFSIIFLVLLPSCLLTMASDLLLDPLARDMKSKMSLLLKEDPSSPRVKEIINVILEDGRLLLGLEVLFLIAYCIVGLFALIVAVYSSAMIYTRNNLVFKEMFSIILGIWKRPMFTWFYMSLLTTAFALCAVVLIAICILIAKGMTLIGLTLLVTLVAVLVYVYLSAVWMMGLVISIVEDDCYGLMALGRAGELIKGRRFQAFILMLLLSLLATSIPVAFSFRSGDIKQNAVARLVIRIIVISLVCLVKLLIAAVYTVFYFDCKAYEEEIEFAKAVFDPLKAIEVRSV